jgi:hypothetical protein
MFKAISSAYHNLVSALTAYAVSIRQADQKFRDLHGLDDHDAPESIDQTQPVAALEAAQDASESTNGSVVESEPARKSRVAKARVSR